MKKILFVVIMIIAVGFMACEEKIIYLFPSFTNYVQFDIDQTTSDIYEEELISIEALNDSIGDIRENIGKNCVIESIDIEGFYLTFDLYDDNESESVDMNAYIRDQDGVNLAVFEDLYLDISAIEEGKRYPLYDYLKEDGIAELRTIINALVTQPDLYEQVIVVVEGVSAPMDVKAHMRVDLHFRFDAKVKP